MSDQEPPESEISADTIEQKNPKKIVNEKRLAQLAKARTRAAEVNRERAQQRLRDKVAKMDGLPSDLQTSPRAQPKDSSSNEQPLVVVEQSESDEDRFEAPGVVFVRRKRPKPKVLEKTAEEVEMDRMYLRMFG